MQGQCSFQRPQDFGVSKKGPCKDSEASETAAFRAEIGLGLRAHSLTPQSCTSKDEPFIQTDLGPVQKELLLGSKVFAIFKQVEKDKAVPIMAHDSISMDAFYLKGTRVRLPTPMVQPTVQARVTPT